MSFTTFLFTSTSPEKVWERKVFLYWFVSPPRRSRCWKGWGSRSRLGRGSCCRGGGELAASNLGWITSTGIERTTRWDALSAQKFPPWQINVLCITIIKNLKMRVFWLSTTGPNPIKNILSIILGYTGFKHSDWRSFISCQSLCLKPP